MFFIEQQKKYKFITNETHNNQILCNIIIHKKFLKTKSVVRSRHYTVGPIPHEWFEKLCRNSECRVVIANYVCINVCMLNKVLPYKNLPKVYFI